MQMSLPNPMKSYSTHGPDENSTRCARSPLVMKEALGYTLLEPEPRMDCVSVTSDPLILPKEEHGQ